MALKEEAGAYFIHAGVRRLAISKLSGRKAEQKIAQHAVLQYGMRLPVPTSNGSFGPGLTNSYFQIPK
ncbi:hypothetical protein Q8A64_13370 [Oxalobacteraceae bacterium R-40]|uniref:Uncharacterized protein n=1 Tax=Keguizhuia sedimenti TaxID=3064264 RepID=A0ABU1BT01_9BURK|nr:hypothetical protein [Oxalobacteraceae bacterium R-40]